MNNKILKINTFCLAILFLGLTSFDEGKLVSTKIKGGVSFGLPESMHPMTDDDIAMKYVSYRNAMGWFTDESRVADFVINNSITSWPEEDLELMSKMYKGSYYNLYDRIDMISEEIIEINERRFAVFEFISTIRGDQNSMVATGNISKYTYVGYTIVKNKVFVFTFNCPANLQNEWKSKAHSIMRSVKVKG